MKMYRLSPKAMSVLVFYLVTSVFARNIPGDISMVTDIVDLPSDFSFLDEDVHAESFKEFTIMFDKTYSTKEELSQRFQNFKESMFQVEAVNSGNYPYKLEINKFADWSWEEFQHKMLGVPQNCSATRGTHKLLGGTIPDKVDWRETGIVTPVKNQKHCGSCWTFSTTGALEAATAQSTGNPVLLSEQQLVDCAGKFNNFGCGGGLPSQAFEYILYNGGIESEEAYPYNAVNQECHFNKGKVSATVKDVVNITEANEDELIDAVAFVRPVSIAYEVTSDFRLYKSGVFTSTICKSAAETLNHAVLAVGFDKVSLPLPHYIVKNSWGEDWGENGYFRIELGKNMCGVATCASYPVV